MFYFWGAAYNNSSNYENYTIIYREFEFKINLKNGELYNLDNKKYNIVFSNSELKKLELIFNKYHIYKYTNDSIYYVNKDNYSIMPPIKNSYIDIYKKNKKISTLIYYNSKDKIGNIKDINYNDLILYRKELIKILEHNKSYIKNKIITKDLIIQ